MLMTLRRSARLVKAAADDEREIEAPSISARTEKKAGHQSTGKGDSSITQVKLGNKSIPVQRHGAADETPTLIFTHGAGGGMSAPATFDFAMGYGTVSPVVCFQAGANIDHRVKCYTAVLDTVPGPDALGGRSMGSRAAILTAKAHLQQIKALVLVSFPMVGNKGDNRADLLLGIDPGVDVLFISGDRDSMCDLRMLSDVRQRMKTRSWMVVVEGADHGMSIKGKDGIGAIRNETGRIAARWLTSRDADKLNNTLSWDASKAEAVEKRWH